MTALRLPYARPGGVELALRIFAPRGKGPFPAMLDLHGGAWTHFDPSVNFFWCRELAMRGILVAQVEFRLAPRHRWPTFLSDVLGAARFLRARARDLDIDERRIGVVGGSTGGHLATLLALGLRDAPVTESLDTPPGTSAHVDACVALWPILDVPGRYRLVTETRFDALTSLLAGKLHVHARPPVTSRLVERLVRVDELRRRRPRLVDPLVGFFQRASARAAGLPLARALLYRQLASAHRGAFASESEMAEASPLSVVEEGRATRHPRMLVVQGERDTNTTVGMTEAFARAYRAAGGSITTRYPPGLGHSYGNVPSREADALVEEISGFIRAC